MTDYLCTRTISGIQPASDEAQEAFGKWKLGTVLMIGIRKVRNPQHHRKFFALLNLTLANQEAYKTLEELRDAVIIQAGYFDRIVLMDGSIHLKPRSIS